ncbi:Crp/Fnr family transcriptional regulator [Sulfurospirillum sp. T05]|uniref:Crp/Fnr family transcriptional regulator n=1 Tax=Sulfurospirillum tamanense TaxID=2813362 RepID=A0ABS2WU57_9BACT|nr:Crp/Fnr family transcriptional regulator [Sulfurospirillum tamanensis]MBN2964719.1 Crp/Fnr family transcriptional regulator [Sulfurospirillum tamanensis]
MVDLQTIPLFSKLSQEDLAILERISTVKSYQKGEILFFEGEEPTYLHVLLDGVLKLYKTNFKGTQIFLHQFYPISFVAELANFEAIPYPATAEFMVDGQVLKIEYETFKKELLNNPELSFKIIQSLSAKLKIMSEVVHKEIILTSEAKVAKFIIEHTEFFGDFKHTKIASLVNLTPETLSRTLTKFKQQGLISMDETLRITQFDGEKLRQIFE